MMRRAYLLFVFLLTLSFNVTNLGARESRMPLVLVTAAPYKYFIEKIAGNSVQVEVLVPSGDSLHSYEPHFEQILRISKADLWFQLGVPAETKILESVQYHSSQLRIVDLCQNLQLISPGGNYHSHSANFDPHIWLSPRMVKTQVEMITSALIDLLSHNQARYVNNLQKLLKELDTLDQEISRLLQSLERRCVLVSYPAYGYFCRDYDLQQLSIEQEGKAPSPKQLAHVVQKARKVDIRTIFVLLQHDYESAELIAKELGATIIGVNPLSVNYSKMMLETARHFAEQ